MDFFHETLVSFKSIFISVCIKCNLKKIVYLFFFNMGQSQKCQKHHTGTSSLLRFSPFPPGSIQFPKRNGGLLGQ